MTSQMLDLWPLYEYQQLIGCFAIPNEDHVVLKLVASQTYTQHLCFFRLTHSLLSYIKIILSVHTEPGFGRIIGWCEQLPHSSDTQRKAELGISCTALMLINSNNQHFDSILKLDRQKNHE